jgi:hypothetical protein
LFLHNFFRQVKYLRARPELTLRNGTTLRNVLGTNMIAYF